MFQSYDVTASPENAAPRIKVLRAVMPDLGIDGLLVPRADEFQGEYVPASSERLAWITGFTGSAGVALICQDQAIVFVDGRYTTQVAAQTDPAIFSAGDLINQPPAKWLEDNARSGFRLGLDPWLHTPDEIRKLSKALEEKGGEVILLKDNPIDLIWHDRPAPPNGAISIQPSDLAGELATKKLAKLAADLHEKKLDAVLICDPSSVAWAFNIRGSDVPHTPHPLARAIVNVDGSAELFIDRAKLGIEEEAYLTQIATLLPPSALEETLQNLAKNGAAILIDPAITPYALVEEIEKNGGKLKEGNDPCALPRAIKTKAEQEGSRRAHLQDGAAMVEFLYWLDQQAPTTITEIEAAQKLEACRKSVGERAQNPLKDISFDTISGAGSNGAIIHYRVTTATNRKLEPGSLYLVDSGGQYQNGTTDITRTVAIGAVGEDERRFFTLVLKGMIAISMARFPVGTRGVDLDPLARIALWKAGADYGHGTGHGVGSYLSVHEGPQRISRAAMQILHPGMILSNEPGYYRPGAFGIRIENLIVVTEAEAIEGGETAMHGFETLTWCPIDRRLVMTELLTREELQWLDSYHAQTRENLLPFIDAPEIRAWLESATASFD
ncbi:aminopeptidase P family protein [Rhizobium sp. L1K21]|uniref:aminopeptidase P family protein n=1 Tax=Rhizobium sp. L1K21 TaxID=2954933 RepID=UPI00209239AC|nr:aminopeptidase P family protein [Rhizobium sp. L1K21]MCO6185660.1 aminopeptidase P family protein [Rhizobium sp. L1K21]